MIKPDAYTHVGAILDLLYARGFTVTKLKMTRLNSSVVNRLYEEHLD